MLEIFGSKKPDQPDRQKKVLDDMPVQSNYAAAVVDAFDRQFGHEASDERRELVQEILKAFFDETLRNADMYSSSEKYEVKYPWGVIDTGTIAKKLYEKTTKTKIGSLKPYAEYLQEKGIQTEPSENKEFIFGSLLFPMHGTPFLYQEEALHQVIKCLPSAFEAIAAGYEPETMKVYTLGSPTNLLGTMSDKLLKKVGAEGAFAAFGSLYAEQIESILSQDSSPRSSVLLSGTSLGGALVTETARHLLESEDKMVTQKPEEQKPKLRILLQTAPASTHTPPGLKALQTALGFALDSSHATRRDEYVAAAWKGEQKFVDDVNAAFARRSEKPMHVNMTPEQKKMKQKGLRALVGNLLKGKEIPSGMKVTEIVGLDDLLTFSPLFEAKAGIQRMTRENYLQRYLVSKEGEKGERKRYGIAMPHVPPFYRENELKRLNRAAEFMERARYGTLISEKRESPPALE